MGFTWFISGNRSQIQSKTPHGSPWQWPWQLQDMVPQRAIPNTLWWFNIAIEHGHCDLPMFHMVICPICQFAMLVYQRLLPNVDSSSGYMAIWCQSARRVSLLSCALSIELGRIRAPTTTSGWITIPYRSMYMVLVSSLKSKVGPQDIGRVLDIAWYDVTILSSKFRRLNYDWNSLRCWLYHCRTSSWPVGWFCCLGFKKNRDLSDPFKWHFRYPFRFIYPSWVFAGIVFLHHVVRINVNILQQTYSVLW